MCAGYMGVPWTFCTKRAPSVLSAPPTFWESLAALRLWITPLGAAGLWEESWEEFRNPLDLPGFMAERVSALEMLPGVAKFPCFVSFPSDNMRFLAIKPRLMLPGAA